MTKTIELESEPSKTDRASWTTWQIILTGFNILNHILIIIVAVYMTCLTYNTIKKGEYDPLSILGGGKYWHPFLCTIGYQLLITQSILAFNSQNLWSKNCTRKTQRTFHWILQAVGSTMAMIGILLEYISREQRSKGHLKATHAYLGMIAGILTLISMVGGVSAFWSVYLKRFVRPVFVKMLHNLNGIAAFVIGMSALFMGYDINNMVEQSRPDIRMLLQAFCVITTILTLLGAARSLFRQMSSL